MVGLVSWPRLCLPDGGCLYLPGSQEFLKKEFSAENVTFWKACERFQQIPASDTKQVGGQRRSWGQQSGWDWTWATPPTRAFSSPAS